MPELQVEAAGRFKGRKLLGPYPTVEEALAHCAPQRGVRIALSYPNGAIVAIQLNSLARILYRRVPEMTGRGGSIEETGAWLTAAVNGLWRPG